jgi:dTDP-4-amino-4,6-dideoxygalactose transaminase
MNYRIGFGNIKIGNIARGYLNEALERNWISEGPNVQKFEEKFAELFGYSHAIATSSGTDAGIVAMSALMDLGAKRGDEVITPALSFAATANCILASGLVPKFVDVELETLNINPELIEAAITPRTCAIQAVHTMGKPCPMPAILDIAKRHGLPVIEDACEAHGAQLNGRVVGSFGLMGIFSCYAAHLVCSGEGGIIVTEDSTVNDICRSVRTHGRRGGDLFFHFDRVGFNSKMNDMEAAIGLEGVEAFHSTFQKRRHLLSALQDMLQSFEEQLIIYRDGSGEIICPHAFPLVLRNESQKIDDLYQYLESCGIQCKTLFGSLPTQHKAFSFLGYRLGDFPIAERIGNTGLHFGIHQYLEQEDLEFIQSSIKAYFSRGASRKAC